MKGQLHNELDEANPVAGGVERFPLTKRSGPYARPVFRDSHDPPEWRHHVDVVDRSSGDQQVIRPVILRSYGLDPGFSNCRRSVDEGKVERSLKPGDSAGGQDHATQDAGNRAHYLSMVAHTVAVRSYRRGISCPRISPPGF